jgi:hypothetical protein
MSPKKRRQFYETVFLRPKKQKGIVVYILHNTRMADDIKKVYDYLCQTPSDINEHLVTLKQYAQKCDHVTELGVRDVVSSFAIAQGLLENGSSKKKHIMVDPVRSAQVHPFLQLETVSGIEPVFHEQSDLVCPLESTDMLFIDSWHIEGQLKRELARWNTHVNKFIILHDTEIDAIFGETIRCGWDANAQSIETGFPMGEILRGLQPAIDEFLSHHLEWYVLEHFKNNNGLTILKRRSDQ